MIFILNLALSVWNAFAAGKAWEASKDYGGLPRLTALCTASLSVFGFTWSYLTIGFDLFCLMILYTLPIGYQVIEPVSHYMMILNSIMALAGLLLIAWAQDYKPGKRSPYQLELIEKWLRRPTVTFPARFERSAITDFVRMILSLILWLLVGTLFLAGILTTRSLIRRASENSPLNLARWSSRYPNSSSLPPRTHSPPRV